ncbi:hypothetical protein Cni_G08338 [Canna indica]|uniref:Uncharacterized protein n=1 Tax=Canna indica TaxID=4628 RepID=A0AAQ3K3Y8_9LILI|nr:hypothetical protein Cni_G08338 [Canna indica]
MMQGLLGEVVEGEEIPTPGAISSISIDSSFSSQFQSLASPTPSMETSLSTEQQQQQPNKF